MYGATESLVNLHTRETLEESSLSSCSGGKLDDLRAYPMDYSIEYVVLLLGRRDCPIFSNVSD